MLADRDPRLGVILTPDDGAAKVTQDDLGNTYDRVGCAYSNYKP